MLRLKLAPRRCIVGGLSRAYSIFTSGSTKVDESVDNGKDAKTAKTSFPFPTHPNPTPHQIFHLPFGAPKSELKSRYYDLVRTHHPDSPHVSHLPPSVAHHRFRSIKASYDFLCGKTVSPHPNARPTPQPKNFDPYLHELAARRRAYWASRGARYAEDGSGMEDEGWAKPGWGAGFAAPKGQQSQWNPEGRKERLILAFGVMTLVVGLFPTLPFTLASFFMPVSTSAGSNSSQTLVSSNHSLIPDLDKTHRAAASALAQAREERSTIGHDRRDGIRKRVKEMNDDPGAAKGSPTKEEPQ